MSLSQRDRLAFRTLLDPQPEDVRSEIVKTYNRAKSKTARGSGHELAGVVGNEIALAAISVFLVLDAKDANADGLETRYQRESTVQLPVFRSAVQNLRRLLNLGSATPTRPKGSPRKAGSATTPTTTPTKRSAPSGSASKGKGRARAATADDEVEEEVITPVRSRPRTPAGSAPASRTKPSSAVKGLLNPSPSKSVNFALDDDSPTERTPSKTSSRKRPASDVDEEPIITPSRQTGRASVARDPSSSPSPTPSPSPPLGPANPMSIFGQGDYAPLPSAAEQWREKPWYVDYDDMLWCAAEDESEERMAIAKEHDDWNAATIFEKNGWTRTPQRVA